MPTIVDELVLRFSLDPKGFDEGQRKVVDKIDKLQDHAKKAGSQVEKAGSNVVGFFRGLEHPVAALRTHLEGLTTAAARPQRQLVELGAQARRTGTSVEAGALNGAAGLRVLGAAGLAAFAAFKGLNMLMTGADKNARGIFGTSLGAAGAGTSVSQFSAVYRALSSKQAVPEADTQSFLYNWQQAQEQYQQGNYAPIVALQSALQLAHIDANPFSDTGQQGLIAAARRFQQVPRSTAVASGHNIGMTDALALGIRREGGGLGATIAAEQRRITNEQSESALRLIKAENDLGVSFDNLKNKVYDELTPSLIDFNTWLKKIVDSFATLNDPNATNQQKLDVYGGMPLITVEWWRRHLPTWLGGRPAGSGAGSSSGSPILGTAAGSSPTMNELVAAGLDEDTAASLSAIARRESPKGNQRNFRYAVTGHDSNGTPTGYTASGYFQMLATNWHKYGQGIVDFSKYPEPIDAPLGLQAKVAAQMYKANGYSPWDSAHGGSIAGDEAFARYRAEAMRNYSGASAPSAASPPASDFDDASYRSAHGHLPNVLSLTGRATQPLDVIRRAQAAAVSKGGDTNHNVEVSGGIHVHTAATTATGIAAATLMAGKNASSLVTQANTGLE